jgi:DNA-binding CsgD family transcriptional regulator
VRLSPIVDRQPERPPLVLSLSEPALESFPHPVGFFDRLGKLLVANRAMESVMSNPPLASEIETLASTLVARGNGAQLEKGRAESRRFFHGTRFHDLRGTWLGFDGDEPSPALCVTMSEVLGSSPSEFDLRRRFNLTPRQARVAFALAEGCTNNEIADLLGVSPHTARHHTESVLSKMGIASRAEVGWTLLKP